MLINKLKIILKRPRYKIGQKVHFSHLGGFYAGSNQIIVKIWRSNNGEFVYDVKWAIDAVCQFVFEDDLKLLMKDRYHPK